MNEFQPFEGFPKRGFDFLKQLEGNNNREWFQEHKPDYQEGIVAPAVAFIATLGERLKMIFPEMRYDLRLNGAGSLMRIYRDIRFSKDKTPYKTYVGIVFWEGRGKKMEHPGLYLHLDRSGAQIYGGMHTFPKHVLPAYREAVADKNLGPQLEQAIAAVQSAGDYEIGGEQYTRVPAGYPKDHPRAQLLLNKGVFIRTTHIPIKIARSADLVEVCLRQARDSAPLHQWLVKMYKTLEA
jgi:uncharacterized protein (TIGR02453 family)